MEHKSTHEAEALARLAQQYKGKPHLEGLIRVTAGEVQALEDGLWSVWENFTIQDAAGAQLDVWGRIVGLPREGRDDDTYRLWLRARVLLNASSGTVPDLIGVARLIAGEGVSVQVTPDYPAGFTLSLWDVVLSETEAAALASFVDLGRAAGVFATFHYFTEDLDEALTLGSTGGGTFLGYGLGDTSDPTAGGALSGVVTGA